jgi:hypothetical protein
MGIFSSRLKKIECKTPELYKKIYYFQDITKKTVNNPNITICPGYYTIGSLHNDEVIFKSAILIEEKKYDYDKIKRIFADLNKEYYEIFYHPKRMNMWDWTIDE